jgi:tetratricopeptide (TPR) repeat protein
MIDIDSLWDFDHPEESETRFRDALASANELESLELMTQIARTYSLRRRFEDAAEILDSVRPNFPLEPRAAHVRWLLELGRIDNSSGQKIAACRWFEAARALASVLAEAALEIDAIHMLAIAAPGRSRSWNELALAKANASENPKCRKWRGSLLNNLGWSHFEQKDFPGALTLFEEALQARIEHGDDAPIKIARWCVGRCLRALDRLEDALAIMNELEQSGDADVYVHEELAILNGLVGERNVARIHAEAALTLFAADTWFVEHETDRVAELTRIAATGE